MTKNLINCPLVAMSCNQEAKREDVVILPRESMEERSNSDKEPTHNEKESCKSDYDVEAESKKILKEMEAILREIQESEFYYELKEQIESEEFQSQLLTRVLSSNESHHHVPMVIYALGTLEETSPKYQLATALLLQQDFSNWISNKIEVFDPILSPADIIALQKLGCTVLSVNEECHRRVARPTLFFMPYASQDLTGNLLEANWSPSNINHVILLTNKLSENLEQYQRVLEKGQPYVDYMTSMDKMEYLEAIQKCIQEIKIHGKFTDIYLDDLKNVTDNFHLLVQFFELPFMEKMQYMEAIQNYAQEIELPNLGIPTDNFLHNFAFHFFNVAPEIDMNTLIPGEEEIRQRFERQFDKLWKMEQDQLGVIIDELISKARNEQMAAAEKENAL